jgi:hypothetical protein
MLKFSQPPLDDWEKAMKFWNIFDSLATTDRGEVINKIDDSTFLRSDGTVYRQEGNLITGSDGSVMSVVDTGADAGSGLPGMAITTFGGFRRDDEW